MPARSTFAFIILLSLLLSACSVSSTPEPTATQNPTLTPAPTSTTAPSVTPEPTQTQTPLPPTPTLDAIAALVPSGVPDAEWNGIPIMPGAIAGQGDSGGYTFTTKATPDEVVSYYELKMGGLGWTALATGGSGLGQNMMIIFNKETAVISMSLIPTEDFLIVVFVK